MMIIAVMISALLMPAQVSAQSAKERKGNNKVQVDKKHGDKKNVYNREGRKPAVHKKGKNKPVVHVHKPAPRPVVVVHDHHHAPRPVPVHRPVVVHKHCNSDAIGAAAVVVGAAALISLLAN